jgi:hypothetical protein
MAVSFISKGNRSTRRKPLDTTLIDWCLSSCRYYFSCNHEGEKININVKWMFITFYSSWRGVLDTTWCDKFIGDLRQVCGFLEFTRLHKELFDSKVRKKLPNSKNRIGQVQNRYHHHSKEKKWFSPLNCREINYLAFNNKHSLTCSTNTWNRSPFYRQ